MKSLKTLMLGVALAAGAAGLGATTAQAAEFRVFVHGPAYVPPCPGPGYAWVAGYNNDGYWVPGRWNFVGVRVGGPVVRGGVVFGHGPYVDRRGWDRDHDRFRR